MYNEHHLYFKFHTTKISKFWTSSCQGRQQIRNLADKVQAFAPSNSKTILKCTDDSVLQLVLIIRNFINRHTFYKNYQNKLHNNFLYYKRRSKQKCNMRKIITTRICGPVICQCHHRNMLLVDCTSRNKPLQN